MSNQTPALSLPTWKDLYDRTEAFFNAPMQALLATDSFVAMMGLTREQFLTQNKTTRDAFEAAWAAARLPSLADHARLAGQVVNLEAKIEGLEDKLDALSKQLGAVLAQQTEPKSESKAESKTKAPLSV